MANRVAKLLVLIFKFNFFLVLKFKDLVLTVEQKKYVKHQYLELKIQVYEFLGFFCFQADPLHQPKATHGHGFEAGPGPTTQRSGVREDLSAFG